MHGVRRDKGAGCGQWGCGAGWAALGARGTSGTPRPSPSRSRCSEGSRRCVASGDAGTCASAAISLCHRASAPARPPRPLVRVTRWGRCSPQPPAPVSPTHPGASPGWGSSRQATLSRTRLVTGRMRITKMVLEMGTSSRTCRASQLHLRRERGQLGAERAVGCPGPGAAWDGQWARETMQLGDVRADARL